MRRGGGQQHTAAAWLARRHKALRRVRLDGWGADKLEVLLASLAGSTRLEALELLQWKLAGGEAGSNPSASSGTADGSIADNMAGGSTAGGSTASPSLELLLHLPGLAALSMECCGLAAVPAPVAALAPSLTSLSLAKNERLGRASATALEGAAATAAFCSAFQPLAALQRLARLDLSHCTLCVLPPALSALPALEELLLAGNRGLGKSFAGGAATFQPLLALAPTLTRLDLGACGLDEVPPQVALLGRLAHLRLSNNEQLGSGGDSAFAPLAYLKGITRLEVANSGLERVPRAEILAGMAPVLADLSIAGSWRLGRGLSGALAPLAGLTALTRLDASGCRLEAAPAELAALPRLAELDLSGNERFGGRQGALAALSRLASLAWLDVRGCWLGGATAAAAHELATLQSLPGLKVVEVEGSGGLRW